MYKLARAYECRDCHAVSMVPLDRFTDLSEEAEPQLPCFNCGEMAGYTAKALYWDDGDADLESAISERGLPL